MVATKNIPEKLPALTEVFLLWVGVGPIVGDKTYFLKYILVSFGD